MTTNESIKEKDEREREREGERDDDDDDGRTEKKDFLDTMEISNAYR